MQFNKQSICVYVCVNICVYLGNRAGWNTTEQSEEHSEGEKAAVVTGVCFPPEGRWFKADLFLSVEEIWGDKPHQVKFSFYEYLPNVPSGW